MNTTTSASRTAQHEAGAEPAIWPMGACYTATVATLRAGLAAFRAAKRRLGITRLRHDQACWAAEMFLQEWESLAIEFGWTPGDIFAPPCANCSGLAYWLGTEIVRALGAEHAVAESGRVYDRVTRQTWVNPYQAETKQ